MKVFGVVGWKNSGKTGLVVRLVEALAARGYCVSTVKHAHHEFEIDKPGKDSHRHRKAGAKEVLLVSSRRWALIHELGDESEPRLEDLMRKLAPVDILIAEGFKNGRHPKIEARRKAAPGPDISISDATIAAVASDYEIQNPKLPAFDIDDTGGIADFIVAHVGL